MTGEETSTGSKVPKWEGIAEILRVWILDDQYKPGQALESEAAIAKEFSVSRPTVRQAIQKLIGEGLLTVAHGRGTFVRPVPDRTTLAIGSPSPEDLISPGFDIEASEWERVPPPVGWNLPAEDLDPIQGLVHRPGREEAKLLRITMRDLIVTRFTHMRLRRSQDMIVVTSNIPLTVLHDEESGPFSPEEVIDRGGIYAELARKHGPVRFTTSVVARMPGADDDEVFGLVPGTPMLSIRRFMLDSHGQILELVEVDAPADRFDAQPETASDLGKAVLRL
ncbi:GntR family transcriptional regulator [Streptomyces sp. SID3343]|uniref:GntR family transcriptional regulator n=1 Tax=Streptomyces sp. SID3343 TaxID=2690260 RepID=UPI00137179AB|nr:GntR family transcriptional regulator [Streptomyces sp. SID3343]MYW00709.1 GntR family transcriptional regulator [Streptomyces sp. SID3343]